MPVPYCLDDCGFVVESEVRPVDSSSFILLRTSILVSTVATLISIPTNSMRVHFFPTSLPNLLFVFFLTIDSLMDGR